ncbi:uncharacterized protein LOC131928667 [Physella acuta]|uniref:uncharacterized protein LOC131928667 n=1 Tax=Physella acuta TaxID=109671 RepID=UPI0027DB3007|nr:uncharacterized protein LOC131928667 [Physella acuta]
MDTCFRFVMSKRSRSSWADAQDECLDWGGNLVTIDDKKKEKFIRQHLRNNFRHIEVLKLFTGLIYTDALARAPYDPRNINHSQQGDSLRWTLTKQAVVTRQFNTTINVGKYHPVIDGLPGNPLSPASFLACVVLVWEPNANAELSWRFESCSEEKLNFICEVRIREEKGVKGRVKRSDHDNPYVHMDLIGDDRNEGDDELDDEDMYDEEEDI